MERGPRARNSDITHIHPISGASPGPENRDKTLFITLDAHTHTQGLFLSQYRKLIFNLKKALEQPSVSKAMCQRFLV